MKIIDPRLKIYFVIINAVLVLDIASPVALGIAVAFTIGVLYMSRIKPSALLKSVGFVLSVVLLLFLILMIWIEPKTALYGFLKCSIIDSLKRSNESSYYNSMIACRGDSAYMENQIV